MYWLHTTVNLIKIIPFLSGWLIDRLLGDPEHWFHPIVYFGKAIAWCEHRFNKGNNRITKGALTASTLIAGTYFLTLGILWVATLIHPIVEAILIATGVFYCLAGKTLSNEVRMVFTALEESIEKGRKQVGRIVGRDTSQLSAQEIRTAALETLAENLSDGVIAPMFWFAVAGLPGMMSYKMINTLDSMIGYKNERYLLFGRFAAQIDDIANYIPARLTGYMMLITSGNWRKREFIQHFGRAHASPNSGYPESALAAILNCQFGGTHSYFGEQVEKPYIGTNARQLTFEDMQTAIQVNNMTELAMGILVTIILLLT